MFVEESSGVVLESGLALCMRRLDDFDVQQGQAGLRGSWACGGAVVVESGLALCIR